MKQGNIKDILKGIAKGKKVFHHLDSKEMKIEHYSLEDGLYKERGTDKSFTEEEFRAMDECDDYTLRIVAIGAEIPLATSEEEVIM